MSTPTGCGHLRSARGAAQALPTPRHFEQAAELVTPDMTRDSLVCGTHDVERHVAAYAPYLEAGFDEVYVAAIGPHYRDMISRFGADGYCRRCVSRRLDEEATSR